VAAAAAACSAAAGLTTDLHAELRGLARADLALRVGVAQLEDGTGLHAGVDR
jgi:hypothetical protein